MMEEKHDLTAAFEKAEGLYAFLENYHPSRSDKLQILIDQLEESDRKNGLIRLNKFLAQYDIDDQAKPSRRWSHLIHLLSQLAKDFTETKGYQPKNHLELMNYLMGQIDDQLKIVFNQKAQHNELSYEAVLHRVSKRYDNKGTKLSESSRDLHDFTYGDRRELTVWLRSAESRDFKIALPNKIKYYEDNHQLAALSQIAKSGLYTFFPDSYRAPLENKIHHLPEEKILAKAWNWPLEFVIGITDITLDARVLEQFKPETYKKIRNFLAYEYENVKELNRAAALMALVFPDYTHFTKYVVNKSIYNPGTQGLDLHKLIDTSHCYFVNNDYPAWGELLLDQGPSRLFYLKAAHLLEKISRNKAGKILTGDLDVQLYNQIAELVGFCSEEDLVRYSDIKVIQDLNKVKTKKSEWEKQALGKPDKALGLPEIEIEGSRFNCPGWRVARVSYHDLRFMIIGRLTKDCVYLGGNWEATIEEGWKNRSSTFIAVFDENNRIRASSYFYRMSKPLSEIEKLQDMPLLFDGFISDRKDKEITGQLIEQIMVEIRQDHSDETFLIGTCSPHLNIKSDINTVGIGEERATHVKVINQDEVYHSTRWADKTVQSIPAAPFIIENGRYVSSLNHHKKPEDPKP